MTQPSLFTVATLGFDERERVMLRDAFRISEHCSPIFRTLVKDTRALPHIVVVNADQPDAVSRWESFRRANEGKGTLSTLMWSSNPQASSVKYTLGRPASLSDLFGALERIVTEEHGYQKAATPPATKSLLTLASADKTDAPEHISTTVIPKAQEAKAAQIATTRSEERATQIAPAEAPKPIAETPQSFATDEAPGAATRQTAKPIAAETSAPIATANAPSVSSTSNSLSAAASPTLAVADKPNAPSSSAAPAKSTPAQSEEIAVVMEPEPSVPQVAPPRSRTAGGQQSRFLVVDDSLPVRIQMKVALQPYAKTIDFAHSGEEAIFLIDNCKYDVIFLDVILPGKDGYEVCRYIRNHALQRQTPVIMLTGNSSPADRVKGKLAGCDTYLIKPVRATVLAAIIGEFTKSSAVA